MTTGFEGPEGGARRGRRDPRLAQQLAAGPMAPMDQEQGEFQDPADGPPPEGEILLLPGDLVMAKVTHTFNIDGEPSWFTYGVQTRVFDGEDEQNAFERTASIVNTRALDMAEDAQARVTEMHRQQEAQRGRIVPRTGR